MGFRIRITQWTIERTEAESLKKRRSRNSVGSEHEHFPKNTMVDDPIKVILGL